MSILQRLQTVFRRKPGGEEDKPPPSERGWTDREIKKIEDDRFDFRDYAEVLAKRAGKADPPLTIGLYGSWGSGKTSLMSLIEEELSVKASLTRLIEKEPEGSDKTRLIALIGKWTEGNDKANLIKAVKKELKRSGNTGLIKKIEKKLPEIETIWIDVWELSNQEEVWQAFLQALFNRVNRKLPWWQRVEWRKLVRTLVINSYRIVVVIIPIILSGLIGNPDANWVDVFSILTNPFKSAPIGTLTSAGLALWIIVKPAIEASREVVDIDLKSVLKYGSYKEQITELMKLRKRFAGMVEDLVGENGRLIVFIDDLDRCTPDKIPDLLEAIKLFTTTPKCVYVLGLDHDIVRQGIYKKYKFEDEREAAEYLEKIVQVPFHLPPLDEGKIEDFIQKNYPEINERCSSAAEVFSKGLEPNPRKVKRALNIYRTMLDLAYIRTSVWEMDPVDDELVAKIVVIQSRYRNLHEYLAVHPDFLIDIEEKILEDSDIEIHKIKAKIREDKTGEILLGDDKVSGLIDEADLHGLVAMLLSGEMHYTDKDQKDQINSYIYLIATAEGTATGVRPNRGEREALLDGSEEIIKDQVEDIQKRGASKADQRRITLDYIKRLKRVLIDHTRYTPSEVASANTALDLFEDWGWQTFEPATVRVPAGAFLMGSTEEQAQEAISMLSMEFPPDVVMVEHPQRTVELSEYRIGRYPVTNLEYREFVRDTGHEPPDDWEGKDYFDAKGKHPVVGISFEDALDYCHWLSDRTGKNYRLPTEAEWEKAARGMDGRIYPWGSEWDGSRCNTSERGVFDTTEAGKHSSGDSPYGLADMAGNVSEWCSDWFGPYDSVIGGVIKNPQGMESGEQRVLRGGSFNHDRVFGRASSRSHSSPYLRGSNYGFRVVSALSIPEWQRKEIVEWDRVPLEFNTVLFDQSLVNTEAYPGIRVPFKNPLFGRKLIPFELNLDEQRGLLNGIGLELFSDPTAPEQSGEIIPGAESVVTAYALIAAGNVRRLAEQIELEGKKLGYLEFHFEEGDPYREELIYGKNLRDWSYGEQGAGQVLTDHWVEQVWRDPEDEVTIDMLRIDFPDPPRNVKSCQISVDIDGIPGAYQGTPLSIQLSGLTYQNDLMSLLQYDREKIKTKLDEVKARGKEGGYIERLIAVLNAYPFQSPEEMASANLALDLLEGWSRWEYEPQTVRIPAGSFLMGSTEEQAQQAIADGLSEDWAKSEQPQHVVELSAYRIGRYPVTNAEYQMFVKEADHPPPKHWKGNNYPDEKGDHPVVNVSWGDAAAYCQWLSEKTGKPYRLPTEAEWENAARGAYGRIYPWGNEWDASKCNTAESDIGDTTPVGQYSPSGDSPYLLSDMVGNVWEWCGDWFDAEEYQNRAGNDVFDPQGPQDGALRVLRGGSWFSLLRLARCASRLRVDPDLRTNSIGFRVVVSPFNSEL